MPDRRRFDPFQQLHAYLHERRASPGRRRTDHSFTIGTLRVRAPSTRIARAKAANDPDFHRAPSFARLGATIRANLLSLRAVLCQLADWACRTPTPVPTRPLGSPAPHWKVPKRTPPHSATPVLWQNHSSA